MSHHHHHHHEHQATGRAFAIAVILNLLFTIIEFGVAIWSNSVSLLGDSGHNFADVLGLAFAWLANWLLTHSAGDRYSYGYKRTTILAAFFNALMLVLTSLFIAYESIDHLFNPVVLHEQAIMLVAGIGIIVNGGTALLFSSHHHDDLNIKGAYLHLLYDALISVGVVITGAVIYFTGWTALDPVVGLLIMITILIGTWALLRDSVNLLLDAVPHHIDQTLVSEYLRSLPGVVDVHDIHIWGLSTKNVALTAHLVMPDTSLSDTDFEQINADLHDKFKIDHVTLQVEKGDNTNPCGRAHGCS